MFINHKMTHRYIYFRFTRHALQLHHVTMLNYLHGYKRLCCQNLAYRQTEIKWSFFVEHLNLWFAGTHENHKNWYTTNKNEFTVTECNCLIRLIIDFYVYFQLYHNRLTEEIEANKQYCDNIISQTETLKMISSMFGAMFGVINFEV